MSFETTWRVDKLKKQEPIKKSPVPEWLGPGYSKEKRGWTRLTQDKIGDVGYRISVEDPEQQEGVAKSVYRL
jgi:hypothetical protein